MIACILIPGFELRAALRARPGLLLQAAALAPPPGREPLLGPVTAAAEAAGVRPGMPLSEALAVCPSLLLVDPDPAGAEQAWEEIVRRVEGEGFPVEPAQAGCLYLETKAVERLYGGVEKALRRALRAVGPSWDARAGAAERKLAALAAASVARAGQILIVAEGRVSRFLAPFPLSLLPLEREHYAELEGLGVRTLGQLASLPGAAVAERLGGRGRRAWELARRGGRSRLQPRRPPLGIVERMEFPQAVANELTLRQALAALVERVLARPERGGRPVRKAALCAQLAEGGSWRRPLALREATADPRRLDAALAPRLAELPAPVLVLALELVELAEGAGQQLELLRAEGAERRARLREGLRQARASVGAGAVSTVVEVAPWSRIPEQRALLVPRDA
jgi:protein ImuB